LKRGKLSKFKRNRVIHGRVIDEERFRRAILGDVRPSVVYLSVCNVRAPYSGDWNFWQYFYAIWYLGHLWPFGKNFTVIVPGEPLRRGS